MNDRTIALLVRYNVLQAKVIQLTDALKLNFSTETCEAYKQTIIDRDNVFAIAETIVDQSQNGE